MKLVLDTNVWLDLLVFDDPGVAALRNALRAGRLEVLIDAACAAELERVLAYELGKWSLDEGRRAQRLEQCKGLSRFFAGKTEPGKDLPRCRDPDDQKFLELARAAAADCLVTKDLELLRLARRVPFRICRPSELFQLPPAL